jgi:hypothetical protein
MNFRPAQIQYGWLERGIMRFLFAVVVERHVPHSLSHLTISTPHSLGRFVDLRFLLDPETFLVCRYLLWAALFLYVLRVAWVVVLPYLALLSIAVGIIINSQGAIGHYLQIMSLVLCMQTAAHFYGWIQSLRGREKLSPAANEDRVISWSQQAIVATYLVSALTKLVHTSGMWFFQSPLIAVEIIKATDQDYYNRLNAAAYGSGSAIAEWIVQHPFLIAVGLGAGLLIELTSPLALLDRRFALCYGLALLTFHETLQRVMKLNFLYNEYLLWIYLVNVPFWIWFAGRAIGEFRLHKDRPCRHNASGQV